MGNVEKAFMTYYEQINDDDDTAWTADFSNALLPTLLNSFTNTSQAFNIAL